MMDSFFDALPEYIELIMGYAPLFIIIVPLAIFIAYRKTQNETKKAKETAELLGLNYINVADEMKESKPEDSFLLKILSIWSTWAMEGISDKLRVRIELVVKGKQQRYIAHSDRVSGSDPTRTSYSRGTVYSVSFEQPLPFDLRIRKNVKMPFGLSKLSADTAIETGDKELDQLIFVSGSDENRIKTWINSNQNKEALKKLYQTLPYAIINTESIHYHDQYNKPDYDHIKNNLTLLIETILKLKMD